MLRCEFKTLLATLDTCSILQDITSHPALERSTEMVSTKFPVYLTHFSFQGSFLETATTSLIKMQADNRAAFGEILLGSPRYTGEWGKGR